jgi:tetratricopeptide (TPR) repeat protein
VRTWNRTRAVVAGLVLATMGTIPGIAIPGIVPVSAQSPAVQERIGRVGAELFARPDHLQDNIRELKAILAIEPRSPEAHMLLGMAYSGLGAREMMGEAVAELRQALALKPELLPAHFFLARVYLDLGRVAKARDELEAGLTREPGEPQFMALLGEAERRLANPARAVELIRQALRADPTLTEAHYHLGLALLALGQRNEAIAEFERIVQSGAVVPDVYLALGRAYLDAGRTESALEILGRTIQMAPSRPDVLIALARAYRLSGRLDEADAHLRFTTPPELAVQNPGFYQQVERDRLVVRGLIRLQQDRLEEAAAAFQQALEADPDHAPAHDHLAQTLRRQGQDARADEHAARAKALEAAAPRTESRQ